VAGGALYPCPPSWQLWSLSDMLIVKPNEFVGAPANYFGWFVRFSKIRKTDGLRAHFGAAAESMGRELRRRLHRRENDLNLPPRPGRAVRRRCRSSAPRPWAPRDHSKRARRSPSRFPSLSAETRA